MNCFSNLMGRWIFDTNALARNRFETFEMDNRFYVNPGSATGAFVASAPFSSVNAAPPEKKANTESGEESQPEMGQPPSPTPSFILLDIQGYVVVCYVYTLVQGEVSRSESSWSAPAEFELIKFSCRRSKWRRLKSDFKGGRCIHLSSLQLLLLHSSTHTHASCHCRRFFSATLKPFF